MVDEPRQPWFPPSIDLDGLGTLGLHEEWVANNLVLRHYRLTRGCRIRSVRTRVRQSGVELVIWPPDKGISDITKFVAVVERRRQAIAARIDPILDSARLLITKELNKLRPYLEQATPSAQQVIQTGTLSQINLNSGPGGHELWIAVNRGGALVGHDLVIALNRRFEPTRVWFDG